MRLGLLLRSHSKGSTHKILSRDFSTLSKAKPKMQVVPVNVLADNFAYLLIDERKKLAAAVDPADAEKVYQKAKSLGVTIESVLTTHHHNDHSGGNSMMKSLIGPHLVVVGGDDRIPELTKKVGSGDVLKVGDLKVEVFFTPCHTAGHVLYLASLPGAPGALFTGDTLFIGGCGRFFEGTADQMYNALIKTIGSLPGNTQIYCGHEYTEKNLRFALTIEPENSAIKNKLQWAIERRAQNLDTVPSTVDEEKSFNVFMRVHEPSVAKALHLPTSDPIAVMAELRRLKDRF